MLKEKVEIYNIPDKVLYKLIKSETDITKLALYYYEYAHQLFDKGEFDNAIENFQAAQKLFLENQNIIGIASCLAEISLTQYKKNADRYIRSLTLLNEAKCLIENDNTNDAQEIKAKIYHYYGIINYLEKQYSEALKSFSLATKLIKPNTITFARVLDSFSVYYLRTGNHQLTYKYISDTIKIKENLNHSRELAKTLILYGRYLSNIENYDEAVKILSKAIKLIEPYNDRHTLCRIQDNLAQIYINLKDFKNAEVCNIESLTLGKNEKNEKSNAYSYATKSIILIEKNQDEEALKILNELVKPIFERKVTGRGIALTKRIEASINLKAKKFTDAIKLMHEAIDVYIRTNAHLETAKCYFELSNIYNHHNDHKMSVLSLLEALRIAEENDFQLLCKKIEDELYKIDRSEWEKLSARQNAGKNKLGDNKALIDTLELVGSLSNMENISFEAPLLALLRIGRSIAAETDVNILLKIIANETKNALEADRCTVFLLDKETNELWSKVALGMGSHEIRIPATSGLAGHVAMTGETINIKDAYNDERFNKDVDYATGYKTKTILCMPMRNINQEIVGVFQILNKNNNNIFTEKDEDLLVAIGSSAGIALENARLFQKQTMMFAEQKKTFLSFIDTLAASIDARDKITAGHSTRVKLFSVAIALQMGLTEQEVEAIQYGATLHDIGKIGIKDKVLQKAGKLTPEEYKHIQQHVQITGEILEKMYFSAGFESVPLIASTHHEKYDGTGYFRGLKGEEIPLGGRIIAVSDVFDAITSKRHYRDRMPLFNVLGIMLKDTGTHFDRRVSDAFMSLPLETILRTFQTPQELDLTEEEHDLFSNYSLIELYKILEKPQSKQKAREKRMLELFNEYYPTFEEQE